MGREGGISGDLRDARLREGGGSLGRVGGEGDAAELVLQ